MLVHQETGRDHKVSILFDYILQNADDFYFYLPRLKQQMLQPA